MTETSTLTPHQELVNKLGTAHPQRQVLEILKKVEQLEAKVAELSKPKIIFKEKETNLYVPPEPKMTRSERMKATWARRKAKK